MLITPRLKIAVQSVNFPKEFDHEVHTHTERRVSSRCIFVVLYNRSLNQREWSRWTWFALSLKIPAHPPFQKILLLNMACYSCQKKQLHKNIVSADKCLGWIILMGLMLLHCGRWDSTLWVCGLVQTVVSCKEEHKTCGVFFFFFFNFIQRKLRLNLKKYSCVDLFLCEVVKLVLSWVCT